MQVLISSTVPLGVPFDGFLTTTLKNKRVLFFLGGGEASEGLGSRRSEDRRTTQTPKTAAEGPAFAMMAMPADTRSPGILNPKP